MREIALTITDTERTALARAGILDAFAAFLRLNVAQGDASPETIRSYHAHVGQFVEWCDDQDIDDPAQATEADLEAYRRHLVEAGYKRGTIGVKLSAVRRLYQAATWRGLRPDNPAEGLKAPREKASRADRTKYLPLEGLRRLLAAPDASTSRGKRDRAIIALMALHGLRVSEVAGMEMSDLALDAGTLRVRGKGRKERTVYLTETTRTILAAWLEVRGKWANADTSALFLALDNRTMGTGMTSRAIRYRVDGYLEGLGLKAEGISCHALRHSAATWARFAGAKLDAIGDMLGHASTDTTRVYAQIVDQMKENPARYLEELLG